MIIPAIIAVLLAGLFAFVSLGVCCAALCLWADRHEMEEP